jgi:hypothetical protein
MTRTMRISAALLGEFLKNPVPAGITQEGLPKDAVIVGAFWDYCLPPTIILHWYSPQWKTRDDGEIVPTYTRERETK